MNRQLSVSILVTALLSLVVRAEESPHGDVFKNRPVPVVVDFNRDVRPILSEKCYHCHGSDEKARKAKLRLDLRAEAVKERDAKQPIKPGDAEHSDVMDRITTKEADDVMPPPKEGHAMTQRDIEIIRKWINQGAPYAEHWAFIAPKKTEDGRPESGSGLIDALIQRKLAENEMKMSPRADMHTLIRRVALDLTGLPPTPDELARFTNSSFDQVVDHYLASPAYGERWARVWLDIARYADSAGYGSDPLRLNIWPYRDWLIKAFNANMHYDQFTAEQLAGDLLPSPTEQQLVATAFHRNTMTNTEGGTDDEEFRVAAVKDRIAVTMQAWMGLTLGCAQCHSHKFDPMTQKEYYQFFAIFNQTEDSDKADESPTMPLPSLSQTEKTQALRSEISTLEKSMEAAASPELKKELAAWEAKQHGETKWIPLKASSLKSEKGVGLQQLPDQSILAEGAESDVFTIEAETDLHGITGIRLEALADDPLPGHGPGRSHGGNFVLSEFKVTFQALPTAVTKDATPVMFREASADFEQADYPAAHAIDGKDTTGWAIGPEFGKNHAAVFLPKSAFAKEAGSTKLTLTLAQHYGANHTLGRFRLSLTTDQEPQSLLPEAVRAVLAVPASERSAAQTEQLLAFYKPKSKLYAETRKKLEAKKTALAAVKPLAIPVMKDLAKDKQRESHFLNKGNFLDPGEKVQPALLQSFHAAPANEPVTRLTVAKWLTSRDNPLTARVMVNRLWAQLYGVGLVETEEDFGTQGTLPSHPELLDALAIEFMEKGWDIKALLKTLVMSQTYQQSSKITPEALLKDSRNRLLSHYPRRRLDAEQVRDQALALSGLLSSKIGGPSVYPPQPDGLWRAAFNGQRSWETSKGEDRYRRGLYTFWRRTVPYPSMATFDAPSRENTTLRRVPTNTPLQAFVTLNDPAYVEMAQALGRRIVKDGGSDTESRVRFGLELCLSRPVSAEQVTSLVQLYEQELSHNAKDTEAATKLAGSLPEGHGAAEMAAWTVIANVLLNLDGVLMKG